MILLLVCVIANGPVFSSGHDLKELTSLQGREYHTQVFLACSEVSLSVLSPFELSTPYTLFLVSLVKL